MRIKEEIFKFKIKSPLKDWNFREHSKLSLFKIFLWFYQKFLIQ